MKINLKSKETDLEQPTHLSSQQELSQRLGESQERMDTTSQIKATIRRYCTAKRRIFCVSNLLIGKEEGNDHHKIRIRLETFLSAVASFVLIYEDGEPKTNFIYFANKIYGIYDEVDIL